MSKKGRAIHRDSDLIGFAVRATTKIKSYIVERRHKGKLYRVTLGKTNEITPVEARKKLKPYMAVEQCTMLWALVISINPTDRHFALLHNLLTSEIRLKFQEGGFRRSKIQPKR